jgi:hypothetical protein
MPILEKIKKKFKSPTEASAPSSDDQKKAVYSHGFEKIYAIETVDTSTIRPMGSGPAQTMASTEKPQSYSLPKEKEEKKAPESLSEPRIDSHDTPEGKSFSEKINYRPPVKASTFSEKKVFTFKEKVETQNDDFQKPENISQMEFDFGEGYRQWLPSAILEQPIKTLNLSPLAYKFLDHKGVKVVSGLLDKHGAPKESFIGLGQGHIDEIKMKVKDLIAGKELIYNFQIEPETWIHNLFADADKIGAYLYLKKFSLESLINLNKEQEVGVKHLFEDQKKQHVEAVDHLISHSEKKHYVQKKLKEVFDTFITPWVEERGGLVKAYEVKERWLNISTKRNLSSRLWDFLENTYFAQEDMLGIYLLPIEKKTFYASTKKALKNYRLVMRLTSSYFYTSELSYTLTELKQSILRESSWYWKGFPKKFIEKALLFSPEIYKSRGDKGLLILTKD